jgi:TPR repeat protein
MDYFPQSLTHRLEDGPVPLPETLLILKDCFSGLAHIHDHRIIHRDIKPENIFITDEGVAKIGDFGVSKRLSASTLAKTFTGTPLYMAPEVMNNPMGDSYDHRADMYSIGLVGYEMLTGMLPFEKECDGDEEEMIQQRITSDIALEGDFPEDIKAFIGRMLSKKPEDRFLDCREVVIKLRALIASYGKDGSTGKGETFVGFKKQKPVKSRVIERDVIKEDAQDREGFEKLRQTLTSAEQGDAEAQFELGRMHDKGRGVDQSDAEALKWYRKAAEQGHAKAQFNLGVMYVRGRGVDQNDTEAVKWYRKAADQGDDIAQYNLGVIYATGQGVDQSDAESLKWFRKAADQGDAKAQFRVGIMYSKGIGVRQSDAEALKWYRKAADQGDDIAQYNLGVMYMLRQNETEALKWFKKAAVQGNAKAQCNMGTMYANGQGVDQSYAEALKWYRKAADQGQSDALYYLGLMYEDGQGVEQNNAEALKWYRKAADQGHAEAAKAIKRLKPSSLFSFFK